MKTVLLIFALALSETAFSETTLQQYEEHRQDAEMAIHFNGIYNGIFWSNVYQAIKEKPMFYCPPDSLGNETPMEILDNYLAKTEDKHLGDDPIAALLLAALIDKYPCN